MLNVTTFSNETCVQIPVSTEDVDTKGWFSTSPALYFSTSFL